MMHISPPRISHYHIDCLPYGTVITSESGVTHNQHINLDSGCQDDGPYVVTLRVDSQIFPDKSKPKAGRVVLEMTASVHFDEGEGGTCSVEDLDHILYVQVPQFIYNFMRPPLQRLAMDAGISNVILSGWDAESTYQQECRRKRDLINSLFSGFIPHSVDGMQVFN